MTNCKLPDQKKIREALRPYASIACEALWTQKHRLEKLADDYDGEGFQSLLSSCLRDAHDHIEEAISIFTLLADEPKEIFNITIKHIVLASESLHAEDDRITKAMENEPLNYVILNMGEMTDQIEDAYDAFDHIIENPYQGSE